MNSLKSIGLISVIFSILLFTSCKDDIDFRPQTAGKYISFDINLSSKWEDAESRSSDVEDEILDMYVIKGESETYNRPLYLHCLTTNISNQNNSRQEQLTRGSFTENTCRDFGVFAFSYDDSTTDDLDLNNPNYIVNDEVTNVNGKWSCGRFWPNEECTLDFYAYSPFSPNGDGVCFPELTYTVPEDFKEQKDLLVSEKTTISYNPSKDQIPVHLDFKHALTSVRFELNLGFSENPKKFEPGIITKVRLVNIPSEGKYNFYTQEWGLNGEINDFPTYEIEFNTENKNADNNNIDKNIIPIDESFFMIPQEFDENSEAKVEIEFTDNFTSTPQKLSFSLAGHKWGKGERVVYKLSTDPNMIEEVFRIVLLPEGTVYYPDNEGIEGLKFADLFKCSYAGISKQIRVESYAKTYNSQTNKIKHTPFPVDFELNNTRCKIEKDETVEGHCENEGFYGYIIEIEHSKGETNSSTESHNAWLKRQPFVGAIKAFNLSNPNNPNSRIIKVDEDSDTPDKGYNTANCYIINAPGKYCFPLVYGNAITAGELYGPSYYCNTDRYKPQAEFRVLKRYPNHNGKDINTPYMDELFTPGATIGAEILWMDKSNLLKNLNVSKTSEGHFIEFEIPVETIEQGNAVIAVTENGVIAWSWHIWITDFNCSIEPDVTVNTNAHSYQFMARNIGWVYNEPVVYNPIDYDVIVSRCNLDKSSDRGNINAPFIIHQSGGSIDCDGYNVFYQWGRMTPFPGGKWSPTQNKEVDCIASGFSLKFINLPLIGNVVSGSAKDCVIYSIKNPCTFFTEKTLSCWMQTADDHSGDIIVNLWSTYMNYHGEDLLQHYEKQYKSIFDPCPVGYMLPQPDSMDAFDSSHMVIDYDKNGMYYCPFGNSGDVNERELFFPFSGYRLGHDGRYKRGKLDYESIGQYYTNVLFNTQMAYHLCLRSGGVIYNPHPDHSKMIDGMSVRPIRE